MPVFMRGLAEAARSFVQREYSTWEFMDIQGMEFPVPKTPNASDADCVLSPVRREL